VLLQRRSLFGLIGAFGLVMGLWLVTIAAAGAVAIARTPAILAALNPARGIEFLGANGGVGFAVLVAVALVLAGADALYAELGHFGARTLRLLWYTLVLPVLLLNYLGQGAALLSEPDAALSPFFGMLGSEWMLPVTVLAIAAAMIAARALICGTAALLRETAQLGFLPRLKVVRNSSDEREHIHIPGLNLVLLALAAGAVLMLRTPQELGAACALASTGAMTIITLLAAAVAYWQWRWNPAWLLPLALVLGAIDLALLGASALKFAHGGWFALLIAATLLTLMLTWRRGRDLLLQKTASDTLPLESFCASIAAHPPGRIDLTAIFLTARSDKVPQALLNNLKYNHVLHARNIILTVVTVDAPQARADERLQLTDLGNGFFRVQLRFGFAEEIDVPQALRRHAPEDWRLGVATTAYFLGRDEIETARPGMRPWRDRLFAFMARNATSAHAYFRIPGNQLIEIGVRWEL
jgi:KUP system potassium uptake protein